MAIKRPTSFEEILATPPRQSGEYDSANTFLDTKAPEEEGDAHARKVKFRIVGLPVPYVEHNPRVWDKDKMTVGQDGKPKQGGWANKPFPDAELNKRGARICTQNNPAYGECPWCKGRYQANPKFAINVIERVEEKDGTVTNRVRVFSKGKNLMDEVQSIQKTELEGEGNPDWTEYGGKVAPDFSLKITRTGQKTQDVRYKITAVPRSAKAITAEEIELLKSVRTISEEDKTEFYSSNPDWKKFPEWYLYGHNLDVIYAPTLLKTATTPTYDLNFAAPVEDAPIASVSTAAAVALSEGAATRTRQKPTPPPAPVDDSTDDDSNSTGTVIADEEDIF